jgi:hypothetical protein
VLSGGPAEALDRKFQAPEEFSVPMIGVIVEASASAPENPIAAIIRKRNTDYSLSFGRLNYGGHRAFALRHAPVRAKRVDLIPGELGFGKGARQQDSTAAGIHFYSMLIGLIERKDKERLQHLDNVVIGMIVVVEQHHVIGRR